MYDERLGWIDPVTEEPVADPNIDPSITSKATTADYKVGIADKKQKTMLDMGFDPFVIGKELSEEQKQKIKEGKHQEVFDELNPNKIKESVSKAAAEDFKNQLEAAGATVTLK